MVGNLIRKFRRNAGLSQEKLAEIAGVHRNFISLIERNLRRPTVEVFIRICKAMNLKASKLIAKIESRVKMPADLDEDQD